MHLSFIRSIIIGDAVPERSYPSSAGADVDGRRGLLLVAGVIAAITLAAALLAFPIDFLLGTGPVWQAPPRGDPAQHLAGAAYYVRSAWTWPPFFVPELDFPDGTSVIFTDSIPLLALPAKALFSLTGFYHPYFAPYLLLCYLLQGPAFALLLHALGVRDRVCLVLGGLVGVLSPVLLIRYGHVALCSHFLLLLALAVHFRATRPESPRPYLGAHLALALAGLLIHPYLGLMLLIVFGTTVLQRLWGGALTVAGAWAQVGAVGLALAATMVATGHLGSVELPPRPYGESGLNLASIVPQRSGLVPGLRDYIVRDPELFAWVGAGGLLLVVSGLWLVRREAGAILARRLPEVLACALTTLFAITYAVYLGPWLILGLPPEKVRDAMIAAVGGHGGGLAAALGAFDGADLARLGLLALAVVGGLGAAVRFALRERRYRFVAFLASAAAVGLLALGLFPGRTLALATNFQASGRFFWVVLYLALAAAAAATALRLPRPAARLVLAAALALQLADVRPLVDELRGWAELPPRPVVPDEGALAPAFAEASAVVLVPDYLCAMAVAGSTAERHRLQELYDGLHFLAARTATPINSMRHSRMSVLFPTMPEGTCAGIEDRARRRAFGPDAVYFFVEPERLLARGGGGVAPAAAAAQPEPCRALSRGLLCD